MSLCWTAFPLSSKWVTPNRHTQAVQIVFQQHATKTCSLRPVHSVLFTQSFSLSPCSLSPAHRPVYLLSGQVCACSTKGAGFLGNVSVSKSVRESAWSRLSRGGCSKSLSGRGQAWYKGWAGGQADTHSGGALLIFKAHFRSQGRISTWVVCLCLCCFSVLFPSRFFC